jgi:hypothetical protein
MYEVHHDTFTKKVFRKRKALWLYEILILRDKRPKNLNSLLVLGNYQYLLDNKYVASSIDYYHKLTAIMHSLRNDEQQTDTLLAYRDILLS